MNPIVSVVLCTFNAGKYLRATIESVLNQSYKDFEFIIWDDGSTDNTKSIIHSYADNRIRYFYHDNTGLGEALQMACNEAKGKYIARIDSDDICMPDRFQQQVSFLESHPDYCLVSSAIIKIDKDGKFTWDKNIKRRNNIVHPASMFRKDVYDKCGGYLPLLSGQDKILWARMQGYGKFYNIKQPLIKYRILSESVSHIVDHSSVYYNEFRNLGRLLKSSDEVDNVLIERYNDLYVFMKNESHVSYVSHKKTVFERFYNLLKPIFGSRFAEDIIIFIVNIYTYLKY